MIQLPGGTILSDAELLSVRTRAFNEAAKYFEALEKERDHLLRLLSLAESFIPLAKKWDYELLKDPPRYGGSDPD